MSSISDYIRRTECCLNDFNFDQTILCEECKGDFHLKCAHITHNESKLIERFICNKCTREKNLLTSWYGREANEQQKLLKRRKYFEVEKILKHRYVNTRRKFLIKWANCGSKQNSWEPESHLDGCVDILQAYLREHELPLSKIQKLVGACPKVSFNKKNWITTSRVIDCISSFKRHKSYKLSLEIAEWELEREKDKLYLYEHEGHCYVILYIHKRRTGYTSDGANVSVNSITIQKELVELLKIKLVFVPYDQPQRADYCGSAAVLIALDLNRHYQKREVPQVITAPKSLRRSITNLLHKHSSKTINKREVYEHTSWLKCPKCGKNFKSAKRTRLTQHMKFCQS